MLCDVELESAAEAFGGVALAFLALLYLTGVLTSLPLLLALVLVGAVLVPAAAIEGMSRKGLATPRGLHSAALILAVAGSIAVAVVAAPAYAAVALVLLGVALLLDAWLLR